MNKLAPKAKNHVGPELRHIGFNMNRLLAIRKISKKHVFFNYYRKNEKVFDRNMDTGHYCFEIYEDKCIYARTRATPLFSDLGSNS